MGGFRVENQVRLCCPCLFGLESVLSFEIKKIGGENLEVTDGRIFLMGTFRWSRARTSGFAPPNGWEL